MAGETNLYVADSGKWTAFTQPSGAAQLAVIDSALDAISGVTLVRLCEAYCYFYLSTKPSAVTIDAGTPGAWETLYSAGSPVTTLVSEVECTHATPGTFTWNGGTHSVQFSVSGSVLVATANREVHIGIQRTRGGSPTVLAGHVVLQTSGVNHVSTFAIHCNDDAQNGDIYTLVARMNNAATNDLTLQCMMWHADGDVGHNNVNDNVKKLATLCNALRSALYDIKLIKGSA